MRALLAALLLIAAGIASAPAFAQTPDEVNATAENAAETANEADATENATGNNTNTQREETTDPRAARDSDTNEDIVGDSGEALVKLFVLAVLLEFALALIFNWRPFIVLLDGRGVKTIFSLLAALVVVYALKPNAIVELMTDYGSQLDRSDVHIARILEAMIIAGGSAGVYNLLVALGIRSSRTEQVAPRPKPDEAWVSVALREKTKTAGPVDVFITEAGKAAEYLGRLEAARARRGFVSFFVRDPARLPPSGGITLQPGVVYTIEAKGKDSAGTAVDRSWGPHALAKRAMVDIEFDM